jgi:hypothetical protein
LRAFYGSKISDHMIETPEGYLICKAVPIARTGVQDYRGIEFGAPNAQQIYHVERPESEVFSVAALASFEGKPVVNEHPSEDVTADNYARYTKGVCRDVRRGDGALSECMVADLIIYDKQLIQAIKNGKRDISCGYNCLWVPSGDQGYIQKEIRGNHVAVVSQGRAGHKVSIRDSKKNGGKKMEKKQGLFGRMLKSFARDEDTTPEDLEQASKLNPENEKKEESTTKDEGLTGGADINERLDRLENAVAELGKMMRASAAAPEAQDEGEPAAQKEPDVLDALENELQKEQPANPSDEGNVQVPAGQVGEAPKKTEDEGEPGVISGDCNEGSKQARDAALEVIRGIKPIIADLPQEKRKKVADSLAYLVRGNASDYGYGTLAQAKKNGHASAQDAAEDDRALGRKIRDKYNPHYMKH